MNHGFAQDNTFCGNQVSLSGPNGAEQLVVIADTNVSPQNSIDVTLDVWTEFGGHYGDGTIIPNIDWVIIG